MNDPSCGTCAHSCPEMLADGSDAVLQCRRYPPLVFVEPADNITVSAWPEMLADQWCGEWMHVEGAET